MEIKAYYQLEVRDEQGKLVKRTRRRLSHSYVRQFVDILYAQMSNQSTNAVSTLGNGRLVVRDDYSLRCDAGAINYLLGLVVGTDDTPVSISDYKLGAQCLHGSGAGQMGYGAQTFAGPSLDGAAAYFVMHRIFSNLSADAITIKEVGSYHFAHYSTFNDYFCCIRDVCTPTTVLPGHSVTLTYHIRVAV
jgi:hypothetical protein